MSPEQGVSVSEVDVSRVEEYRQKHDTAIMTILFSDIVGYTSMTEKVSESELMTLLARFEALTSACLEEGEKGLIVKRIGDAVLCVFAEPTTAVRAALDLHDQVGALNGPTGELLLRTGIHLGQVALVKSGTNTDVFGRHVNRAARIQSSADPGQILVTEPVADNALLWVAMGGSMSVAFHSPRELTLKGIPMPVWAYVAERSKAGESDPDECQGRRKNSLTRKQVNEAPSDMLLTVHFAMFEEKKTPGVFLTVTNLSKIEEVEITNAWFDTSPQLQALQPSRSLPKRLQPQESWATWVELKDVPPELIDEDLYSLGRASLSSGQVVFSSRKESVVERGFLAGGGTGGDAEVTMYMPRKRLDDFRTELESNPSTSTRLKRWWHFWKP